MASNTRHRSRKLTENISENNSSNMEEENISNLPINVSNSADEPEEKSELTQLIAKMIEGQNEMMGKIMSKMMESQQQNTSDMANALQQLATFQQHQVRLQEEQNRQQQDSTSKTLARTSAGSSPIFAGKSNDIEVHRWVIAMDRWFETTKIEQDNEKITIAASSLRESAQAWWAGETQMKRAEVLNTWRLFTEAIKKQFLPMDVNRWARVELRSLLKNNNQNILEYTSRFNELDQLIGRREELDRIVDYEEGLPDEYRFKSVEKRHSTLIAAVESTIALYKAKLSTRTQVRTASINQLGVEGIEMNNSPTSITSSDPSSSTSFSPGTNQTNNSIAMQPQTMSSLQEQVAQLTKIITQQSNRGGYYQQNRGGYRNGWQGRSRGGSNGNGYNRSYTRSRSPSQSLTSMGITREIIEQRKAAKQCLKCGEENHFIGSCRNQPKTTN
jgi:hypothetical protein